MVWTPVLQGDTRDSAIASTKNIYDPRATHFWDDDQSLGIAYGRAVDLPNDRELAWDIYFTFDDGTKWDDKVPTPSDWMHQLGQDDRYLDGDRLRELIRMRIESESGE